MGSRTTDTLKEIEEIRARLDERLTELGTRLPPVVQWSRRAAGGLAGGVVLFTLNRMRARAKKAKPAKAAPATGGSSTTINTGMNGAAAVAVAAIWAGVRVYEARTKATAPARAEVRSLPVERRA